MTTFRVDANSLPAARLQPAGPGTGERAVAPLGPRAEARRLERTEKLAWLFLSITIIVLAVISRVGMIAWPFLNDSGLYAALGRTVANGDVLYRDFYETKLPGAALLASAFWHAFGSHWAGYVLCQLAMAFLAAVALARTARQHFGSAPPTFLFATVFLNLSQAVYTGFQLETIQAFFEALAAMAAIEALANDDLLATFAAGLAAGTAAMAKPGGLGVAAAFAIVLLVAARRKGIHLAVLVGGIAIPTGVTILYTVQSGAWPYLPTVIRDIQHYATGTPIDSSVILKLLAVLVVMGLPFLFVRKKAIGGTPMLRFFIFSWLALDLLAVLMQRRLYPYHFLPLACPLALLYGRMKPMQAALGLLPIALLSLTWEGSSISKINRGYGHLPASDYIAAHTTTDDFVFADQIGRLLIETDRHPGSRLGTFFYLVNDDNSPQQYTQILISDFETRKPKYLMLTDGWDKPIPGLANCDILQHAPKRRENFIAAWATLREYVAGHYHLECKIDNVLVYRRN
jgi:hypothetical protein